MPVLETLLGGAATGAAGGFMGLFGGNEGPKDPDLLDPVNLLGAIWTMLDGADRQRIYNEMRQRTAERFDVGRDILTDSLEGGMAIYDDEAEKAQKELERLQQSGTATTFQLEDAARRLEMVTNAAARARSESVMGGLNRNALETQTGYRTGVDSLLGRMSGNEEEIIGGYRDRYAQAERDLTGYGDQQKADIDRRFEDRYGAITQDLIGRGLASSTESAKQGLLNTELQSSEQRRLGEDLARNRINILSGLSGEQLAAQERLGGRRFQTEFGALGNQADLGSRLAEAKARYDAMLSGDALNTQAQMGQYVNQVRQQGLGDRQLFGQNLANQYNQTARDRSQLFSTGMGNLANLVASWEEVPPPQSQNPFLLGQNAGGGVQYPSAGANFLGGFAQPFAQAAATALFQRPTPTNAPWQNVANAPAPYQGYDSSWMTGGFSNPPPPPWGYGPPAF